METRQVFPRVGRRKIKAQSIDICLEFLKVHSPLHTFLLLGLG
jgi:hypothetical protein